MDESAAVGGSSETSRDSSWWQSRKYLSLVTYKFHDSDQEDEWVVREIRSQKIILLINAFVHVFLVLSYGDNTYSNATTLRLMLLLLDIVLVSVFCCIFKSHEAETTNMIQDLQKEDVQWEQRREL